MSELTLSTGQKYNTQLKGAIKAAPTNLIKSVGRGIRMGSANLAGSVVGSMFGDTVGSLVSSLGYSDSKKNKEKSPTYKDMIQIVKAELKGLLEKDVSPEEQPKAKKQAKVLATPQPNVDISSFMREIAQASNDEIQKFIKDQNITDEQTIEKLKVAQQAAIQEIAKTIQSQVASGSLTVEHLKNIEGNTEQLLQFFDAGKQEEQRFEEKEKVKGSFAVQTTRKEDPLMSLLSKGKDMLSGLAQKLLPGAGAAASMLGKFAPHVALGAIGLDSVDDAINSYKTGDSNKYSRAADSGFQALTGSKETIGGAAYNMWDSAKGMFGFSDQQKEDDRLRETLKPSLDKVKSGGKVNEQTAKEIERLFKVSVPVEQITTKSVTIPTAPEPVATAPQSSQARELVSSSSELSLAKEEKASQPIVIPMPVPQAASKKGEEVLNYVTTNVEPTFRRLSEKLLSTAFV